MLAGALCWLDFPAAALPDVGFPVAGFRAADFPATAPEESGLPDPALRCSPDGEVRPSGSRSALPAAWPDELGPGAPESENPTATLAATDAPATVAAATASVSRLGPRRYPFEWRGACCAA